MTDTTYSICYFCKELKLKHFFRMHNQCNTCYVKDYLMNAIAMSKTANYYNITVEELKKRMEKMDDIYATNFDYRLYKEYSGKYHKMLGNIKNSELDKILLGPNEY